MIDDDAGGEQPVAGGGLLHRRAVLIAILAAPYLGERVSRQAAILMVVSIIGVALVVAPLRPGR